CRSMYLISAGSVSLFCLLRIKMPIPTGVSMLNTAFFAGGCFPSGVRLIIQPREVSRRIHSRIPLNPGPFRYPVAVIKQTTPSVELGMLSKTFHIAQRQKYTYRFLSTYSYFTLNSLRISSSGTWFLFLFLF